MLVGWDKQFFPMTYWKYSQKTRLVSSSSLSNPSNLFSISVSLCGDTGTKQSLCPKSSGRKYIMPGTPETVACFDFLIRRLFQYSFNLSRSVWSRSAKQNHGFSINAHRASVCCSDMLNEIGCYTLLICVRSLDLESNNSSAKAVDTAVNGKAKQL